MSDREHRPAPEDGPAPSAEPSVATSADGELGTDPRRPVTDVADGATAEAPTDPVPAAPDNDGDEGAADAPSDGADPAHDELSDGAAEDDDPATAQLRAELVAAELQRDEYLDDVRRARAEFENFRKRTTREAGTAREHGRADVAGALLDVLDDLDRTVEAAQGSSDESLAKAVDLVADKFRRALVGQGLERVDATEVPFDPEVHEAVQQVEAEEPTDQPQVHQVLRPGYRLGDRTLRAAMVVVAG